MNEQLYDVRVGVETYARVISESISEKETWRDMVRGAAMLCLEFQEEPACSENPYLCSLLVAAVICVLLESEDFFGDSDHVRELALVKSTKNALEQMVSEFQKVVDDCYPKGAKSG